MTASSRALREGAMSATMVVGMPVRNPVSTVATSAWIWPHTVCGTEEITTNRDVGRGVW